MVQSERAVDELALEFLSNGIEAAAFPAALAFVPQILIDVAATCGRTAVRLPARRISGPSMLSLKWPDRDSELD